MPAKKVYCSYKSGLMRSFSFIILLTVSYYSGYGQSRLVDSLLKAESMNQLKDTALLNTYIGLIREFAVYDTAKSFIYFDKALQLSKKLQKPAKTARSFAALILTYYYSGHYEKALQAADSAELIYSREKDIDGQALTAYKRGRVLNSLSQNTASTKALLRSLELYSLLKDSSKYGATVNCIGSNYYIQSDFAQASKYYTAGLTFFEQRRDSANIINALVNLGLVHKRINRLEQASTYFNTAEAISLRFNDQYNLAKLYSYKGDMHDLKSNYDSAMLEYEKAAFIQEAIKDSAGLSLTYTNYGIAGYNAGLYSQAYDLLQKGSSLLFMRKDFRNYSVALRYMGLCILAGKEDFLKKLGIPLYKRYQVAEDFIIQSLNYPGEDVSNEMESLKQLAYIYSKQQKYDAAYSAMVKADSIKEIVFNSEKNEEIIQHRLQYEYEKETTIRKIQYEDALDREKLNRNFVATAIGLIAVTALGLFYFNSRKKAAIASKKEAELKTKVLRLQMNPHFIFNSLNSVSDYIRKNDIENADDFLVKFAKTMRMTLEYSEQKFITLSEEIGFLRIYTQLESRRMNNRFTFEVLLEQHIQPEKILLPPLLLQPIVENSIWHGMTKIKTDGKIILQVSKKENTLQILIEDNGAGLRFSSAASDYTHIKDSMALNITKARLALLNDSSTVIPCIELMDKKEGGVKVLVTIPYISE
jgi:tetratricopeptide (TPR) repeat protein